MASTTDQRQRLLIDIPLPIKTEAARRADDNLNDELVGVLCRAFGVKFDPTGYKRRTISEPLTSRTLLRVPDALKRKVVAAAVRNRTNQTIEVCNALAIEYGVAYEPASGTRAPVGGGRRAPAAAA